MILQILLLKVDVSKIDFVNLLELVKAGVGVLRNLIELGQVARADLFCVFVLTQESMEHVRAQSHHETVHLIGVLLDDPLVVSAKKGLFELGVCDFVL